MICWKCRKEINVESVFRTTECPECHADLHSCKGCSFYSQGNHFDCSETIEYPVTDKEKSNFCDFFRINQNISGKIDGGKDKSQEAKNAFNALFGD